MPSVLTISSDHRRVTAYCTLPLVMPSGRSPSTASHSSDMVTGAEAEARALMTTSWAEAYRSRFACAFSAPLASSAVIYARTSSASGVSMVAMWDRMEFMVAFFIVVIPFWFVGCPSLCSYLLYHGVWSLSRGFSNFFQVFFGCLSWVSLAPRYIYIIYEFW